MIWTNTFVNIVFSIMYFSFDVNALSTLGREFLGGFIAHPDHLQECIFSIFTYNYNVEVNSKHFSFEFQEFDVRETTTIRPDIFEKYSVQRHNTTEIRITSNSSEVIARIIVHHSLELKGNDDFGVSVLHIGKNEATSMYTLLPFRAYGTIYNIYILKANQSVAMHGRNPSTEATYESIAPTRVSLKRRYCVTHDFKAPGRSRLYYNCNITDSDDDDNDTIRGTLTTASNAIGLTVSNCYSKTDIKKDCELTADSAMDVVLPRKFAAKEFIAFDVGAEKNDVAHVIVMGLFDETQVKVYSTDQEFEEFTLIVKTYKEVALKDQEFQLIKASEFIQVYLFTQSTCLEDGGSPSLTMLIPNLLFFNRYIWSIPYNKTKCDHHFLIIIKKSKEGYNFIFDNKPITISSWNKVKGLSTWYGTHYSISPDSDLHTIISGTNQPFGCYLYGRGVSRSYLHFAGFMVTRIEFFERFQIDNIWCAAHVIKKPRTCKRSPSIPGDLIDNDCDGRIDEESSTKTDDDEDGEIGEDVISFVPEYFSKYSVPATKPTPASDVETTPTTAEAVPDTTQRPPESNSTQLLLLILMLIPVVSALLYYFIRKKETPPGVGEELEGPAQSRDAQSFGIYGEQQSIGQHSVTEEIPQKAFASPGRTKSTYLH